MSADEVNRRLAEALGWELRPWDRDSRGRPCEPELRWFAPGAPPVKPWSMEVYFGPFPTQPPNFCADLNACATARKALTEDEREEFAVTLHCKHPDSFLRGRYDGEIEWDGIFVLIDATAEPQARAILAVLEGRVAR